MRCLMLIVAIATTTSAATATAADWITLPAAPPKKQPADPAASQREDKLNRERSDMAQDWQHSAEQQSRPRHRVRNYANSNDISMYAFHFNDSWNTPLKLPTMITPQDFPTIAPPLPPKLPHGLGKPLGGAPHNNLPSPQFNHSHW